MKHQFQSHGFAFRLESDDFRGAEDDFSEAARRMEEALNALPTEQVAELHSDCVADAGGDAAKHLDRIAGTIVGKLTKDWHDPAAPIITFIAVPTRNA